MSSLWPLRVRPSGITLDWPRPRSGQPTSNTSNDTTWTGKFHYTLLHTIGEPEIDINTDTLETIPTVVCVCATAELARWRLALHIYGFCGDITARLERYGLDEELEADSGGIVVGYRFEDDNELLQHFWCEKTVLYTEENVDRFAMHSIDGNDVLLGLLQPS
jgi:hypothetical protein